MSTLFVIGEACSTFLNGAHKWLVYKLLRSVEKAHLRGRVAGVYYTHFGGNMWGMKDMNGCIWGVLLRKWGDLGY